MCGLCGEIRFDGQPAAAESVARMAAVLQPRGPDGAGVFAQAQTALGHRRLKIIDLSDRAQQPMVDAELGLTIAFNGCIYNYQELRAELKAEGYRFFSNGDTEVVLKAYHAWGNDCVKRFHGMFAFAITERESGRLVLARDRLGIKPLYLADDPSGKWLRFASTLPALLAGGGIDTAIDPAGLNHYMNFHAVVPPPVTILKGVKKLPPATIAVIERDGARHDHVYWDLTFERDAEDLTTDFETWRERVHEALLTAVRRRMVADVPVGVLLSGGVDSSLIVGLLANEGQAGLKTFSIGFEAARGEKGDEFIYSDVVARHFATEHHKVFIEGTKLLEALPATIASMSEPMVSHDNVGFFLLSKEVAKHVKVVQSGQGADEIFAGYHWYPKVHESNHALTAYRAAFFDRTAEEYAQTVAPEFVGEDYSEAFVTAHFDRPGADQPVDKALRLDTQVMLVDDPVKRVDNMTMAWGLEGRVPFLDHELVELAARIPPEHKLADDGKGVLKAVARKVVPREVIDRPKGYFPVPALKYLEGPYLEMVRDAVSGGRARERGLWQSAYVDQLLDAPSEHITPLRGSKLWQVALLELWLQTHDL
jgi:asparagine synthase (glutamine-hydrolysing)